MKGKLSAEVEGDKICVTMTLEDGSLSKIRLAWNQAEILAMQLFMCVTQLQEDNRT